MARKHNTTDELTGSRGAGGTVLNPDAPDTTYAPGYGGNDEGESHSVGYPAQDSAQMLNQGDTLDGPTNGITHRHDASTEAKKPKKTPEEKRADFNRLASGRVSRAIDALSSLLHLANTSTYEWTDEARAKIFSALRDKIDTAEASFVAAKAPTDGKRKSSKQLSFRVDL